MITSAPEYLNKLSREAVCIELQNSFRMKKFNFKLTLRKKNSKYQPGRNMSQNQISGEQNSLPVQ